MRYFTGIACAAMIAASASVVSAQSRVQIGMLECRGASASFVVGSVTDLNCTFHGPNGMVDTYIASIQKIGLDLNLPSQVTVGWAVLAPTRVIGPGELAGN